MYTLSLTFPASLASMNYQVSCCLVDLFHEATIKIKLILLDTWKTYEGILQEQYVHVSCT